MSFWLPAVGGALFILAGAWWIATPAVPGRGPPPASSGVTLDAGHP